MNIIRRDSSRPIFVAAGRDAIFVRAGTEIHDNGRLRVGFAEDFLLPIDPAVMAPGADLDIVLTQDDRLTVVAAKTAAPAYVAGGFHFAPGGNAEARNGGDSIPAINPCSIWDQGFRPSCPDPRGMFAIMLADGARAWVDIYKLGVDHLADGTSRFGVTIADGNDLPKAIAGKGKVDRLDFATATAILAHHGKQPPTYDEFRIAAFGVTEKTAASRDPKITGLDAPRTSRFGMMQATGNLWDWGTDGDPDNPCASILGGSWISGGSAGSRYANLDYWPGSSVENLGARGRSDHLNPAN